MTKSSKEIWDDAPVINKIKIKTIYKKKTFF